ncbi:MAG: helix-turn-helix domain-containing protein [Eubacteriales bacterium]|nr:helix-turn-helix domain-containing protein [Eubacteriales bacterium]
MYQILFADNERMALLSSERSLRLADYHMQSAASLCDAFEAMRLLENHYFDAAFLDIRMPGLSGLDIIRRRMEMSFCPAFVMISGYSDFIYMKQAIQLGAFDYCLKPLQQTESNMLLARLEPQLYQNRLRNGPLLLAHLSDLKTQTETLAFCGISQKKHPITVIAVSVPSCRDLLALPSDRFFSIFLDEQKALLFCTSALCTSEDINRLLSIPDCRMAIGNFDCSSGRLSRLLKQLQTDLMLTGPDKPLIQTVASSPNDSFQQLLEEVRQEYTKELSLQTLAQKYSLNYSYCSELFKASTGFTFSKYLTQLRMNAAAQLLFTDLPVTDISFEVGYRNYHHFVSMFKSFFGVTPTEYRLKKKGAPGQ